MAITVTNIPGYQFTETETWTPAKLNLLGQPTFTLTGSITASDIAAGAVTAAKSTPGPYWYAAGTLTTNTYAVTLSPALAALTAGSEVWFKADADYVDAGATGICLLNVNGLGAVAIKKNKGDNLDKHDIITNQIVGCRYDGTFWQMISHLGHGDTEFIATDSGAVNAFAIAPTPAYTAYNQLTGRLLYFEAANTNTGPSTLQVSGIGSPPTIKKNNDEDVIGGDIEAGQIVGVMYDGTVFQLMTPVSDVAIGNITGHSKNLRVAIASTTTITVTADELFLRATTGRYLRLDAVSVTADITVTGANGRDSFTEASGTWYYLWVIHNGTAAAALLSATNDFGTLTATIPSGYNARALVGAVYNDSSSNFFSINEYADRKRFISGEFDLGSNGEIADVSHNLGGLPREVEWRLRCDTTDIGYSEGEEIAAPNRPGLYWSTSSTNVFCGAESSSLSAHHRTTGNFQGITEASWKVVCYATL